MRSANGGINALELPHVKLHASRHLLLMTHGVGAPTDESFSAKISGQRCLLRALSEGGYGGASAAAEAAGPARGVDFAYVLWSSRSARMAQVTAWLSRLHVPLHPVIRETARKTLLQAALYLGGYREDIAATLQAEFNAAYTSYLATHPLFAERNEAIESLMRCDCRMSERAGWGAGPAGGITTSDGAGGSNSSSSVQGRGTSFFRSGSGSGSRSRDSSVGGSGGHDVDQHDAGHDDDDAGGADDGRTCPAHARPSHTSLWCHSLGGVMALDLLVARPYSLVFTPMHLFTLGSPMGLYLSLRGLPVEELHDYLPRLYLGPADPGNDAQPADDHHHHHHHGGHHLDGAAAGADEHGDDSAANGLRALADVHLHYDYRCHYFPERSDGEDATEAAAVAGAAGAASSSSSSSSAGKQLDFSLALPAGRAPGPRARALLRPFPATQLHNLFDVQDAVAYLVAPLLWPASAHDGSGPAADGSAPSSTSQLAASPVPLPRTVPTVTGEDARREYASLQVQIEALAAQLQEQRAVASGASSGLRDVALDVRCPMNAAAAAAAALTASPSAGASSKRSGEGKPVPAGIAAALAEGLRDSSSADHATTVVSAGLSVSASPAAAAASGAAAMPLALHDVSVPAAAAAEGSAAKAPEPAPPPAAVGTAAPPSATFASLAAGSKPMRLGVGPALPLQWNAAVAYAPAAGAPITSAVARRTASGKGVFSAAGAGSRATSSACSTVAEAAAAAARATDPLSALYHSHGLDLPLPVDPALLGEQNPFISIAAASAGMGFGAAPRDESDGDARRRRAAHSTAGSSAAAAASSSAAGAADGPAAASGSSGAGSAAPAPTGKGARSGSTSGGADFVQALERMRDAADAQVGRLGLDKIAHAAAAVTQGKKGAAGGAGAATGAAAGGNSGGAVSALWGGGGGGGGLDLNSGLSTLAAMGEYLTAAAAHRSYWEHPDVLGYVLLQIARRERDVLAARLARARVAGERARVKTAAADAASSAAAAKAVAAAAAAVATAVRTPSSNLDRAPPFSEDTAAARDAETHVVSALL